MAQEVEIVNVSTRIVNSSGAVPVANAVTGSTADSNQAATLQGWLKRTDYKSVLAGTTWLLSTAAVIDTITVIPATTAATTLVLSDGTTAILSIPAAAHSIDPHPYTINLGGIRNTAAAGFKIVTGASVAAVVKGSFVGTPTTA
jgi:hypothetical protein